MKCVLLITVLICLMSCNLNNDIKIKASPIISDTTKSSIRKEQTEYFLDLGNKLNLQPITQEADSFELRLWINSIFIERDLITLKYKDKIWIGKRITYEEGNGHVSNIKERKLKPNISINTLVDSLKIIDFKKFLSQDEIENFKDNLADGVTYHVEIATNNFYKILTYHCPEHFEKEINNRNFLSLIYLLDKYFHFYTPLCKP